MEQERVIKLAADFKEKIDLAIAQKHYDHALELIYSCSLLLYLSNVSYVDDGLEAQVRTVADRLFTTQIPKVDPRGLKKNTILFYDGVGFELRGLTWIYLDALVQDYQVCYVTYTDREPDVTGILQMVRDHGGTVSFINRGRPVEMIRQLNAVLDSCQAEKFFFYSYSYDIVAPTLMSAYEGILKRYQINLTDHGFWLGAHATDWYIEFRDYGASITNEYRGVPREKIVKLPFYPKIVQQEFLGFPFPVKDGQKVVFSGGSLYKTFGEGNKYYKIVDYILDKHSDVIFWYAGGGDDSELKKCMARYPGRVLHTPERPDLFQILQHVSFYLSTYPICGGQMYQYAAAAGALPLTLRASDDNDGFLLNQDELGVIFDTMQELSREIDRVLTDESYRQARSEQIRSAVISAEQFSTQLHHILSTGQSPQEICYRHMDTEAFRANYLSNITEEDILWHCVRKETIHAMVRYLPGMALRGILLKLRLKLSGKL